MHFTLREENKMKKFEKKTSSDNYEAVEGRREKI